MNVNPPTATKLVAIRNALAASKAVDWFIWFTADMTSPIPGDDEISEDSEVVAPKSCFEVAGNAEVVVVPRSEVSDEEVTLDLLGGGGVFKLLSEIRCLRNMKSGMASARLVPMNCNRYLVSRKVSARVLTADIGSHVEILVCRDVDGGDSELIVPLFVHVDCFMVSSELVSQCQSRSSESSLVVYSWQIPLIILIVMIRWTPFAA